MQNTAREDLFDSILKIAALESSLAESDYPAEEIAKTDVPKSYDKNIRLLYKKLRFSRFRRAAFRSSVRAVSILFLLLGMSFSFLLLDAQVRAACRNAAVTFYEKYVEILVHPRPSDLSLTVSVGYLPIGYHLADTISQDGLISLTYQDESGGRILIQYNRLHLVQQADAEHYTVEDIQVHSCDGKFFLSQDPGFSNMLLWYSENGTYAILADLEKAELLKIAENIQ